jgi:hypothetical protein
VAHICLVCMNSDDYSYLGVAWNADDSRPSIKVTKDSLLGFIPNVLLLLLLAPSFSLGFSSFD